MFIPIESSFALSIRNDSELFDYAWSRKVVIVSPSTLLATLRTVESIWKMDKQNKNTIEIADKAGKLYDKFVGFYTDLMAVEKNLDRTSSSLVDAMKKLKVGTGDLIGKVQELKTLGAKAKKSLPESLLGEDDN